MPESVVNLGGDTFYNCKRLKRINIGKGVRYMGNNPFAGCPDLVLTNESPYFIYEGGILYNKGKDLIIYCSIKGVETELDIREGVRIIGKHAFYLCDRFKRITLPASLLKMENNPFSGCSQLELISLSDAYYIQDDVIYNGYRTAVVGTLNRIKTKRLELLEGVKTINRNSFWNCKGIETIVFPASLEDIGYNPFVGCSNIRFESQSEYFKVIDGVLYNRDCSKLICYPAWKAIGLVELPDSVITLERGAFSGCDKMTKLNLHNVNIINKSCFTNCTGLQKIYCSDFITYIGEWAFAYCSSLQEVSVYKDTIIDNNAFSNASPTITRREQRSNYLVESDNLYTLSSMGKAYKGKLDAILIDPPYNSNIDYIGYKDTQFERGYYDFMRVRLEKAYQLLSQKGFLIEDAITYEEYCHLSRQFIHTEPFLELEREEMIQENKCLAPIEQRIEEISQRLKLQTLYEHFNEDLVRYIVDEIELVTNKLAICRLSNGSEYYMFLDTWPKGTKRIKEE